ncbi:hypothetical protein DPX16_4061 [Anabarilius grahami]|uniref:Uncharacterized protein n=1 Tax=Anabarilius grahami TaxID=495550 RepID=A0A3N0XY74_ANAGA|nr:hypothetical protein DPX16_4061 [Anabarilius grahami]
MRIVSNGVQPYIVQTGVDTDGETQEEVTTFRMKLDVSEWPSRSADRTAISVTEGEGVLVIKAVAASAAVESYYMSLSLKVPELYELNDKSLLLRSFRDPL